MIRLAISVEGQTEEEFVKDLLGEHLTPFGVEATPVQVGSARNRWKGGNVSESVLIAEMRLLSHNFDAVTSLVDFYGFRGKRGRTVDELVAELQEGLRGKIGPRARFDRVIPYVQLHEFEGLLFSRPDVFRSVPEATEEAVAEIRRTRARFASPEDINEQRRHCAEQADQEGPGPLPESSSRSTHRSQDRLGDHPGRVHSVRPLAGDPLRRWETLRLSAGTRTVSAAASRRRSHSSTGRRRSGRRP